MTHHKMTKEKLPLISVISPVYNTQDYLPASIESILNQTYPNWELIFIDDGSSDCSAEIIRRYAVEDSRIKLVQSENHGQGYERNRGLEMAQGKYVMFFDSDDCLEAAAMELAVTRLESEKTDFAVFDWYKYYPFDGTAEYNEQDAVFAEEKLKQSGCLKLLKTNPIYSMNQMFRTDFLRANDVRFGEGYIYEDWEFWIKAVLSAESVSLIHLPLYRLTANLGSSTRTRYDTDWHCSSFIKAMDACLKLLKQFSEKIGNREKYDILLGLYYKFGHYYSQRTPARYKEKFLREYVDRMSNMGQIMDFEDGRMFSFLLKCDAFSKKKYLLIKLAILYSTEYKPMFIKLYTPNKKEV